MNIFDLLPATKAEAVTDTIAVGAISSPLWLHQISGIASDALPLLGFIWLAVQIGVKIHTTYWKKK
ncbi:MAG TPA: hypothetical protein VN815_13235 [Steroidobacteraceae bacterium]|nr:hypothetical protein [Steroidobacteraceae bacterium]